jgi:hypothetical protein
MRYDRARQNLDRHPNCILAAYMARHLTQPASPATHAAGDVRHCR